MSGPQKLRKEETEVRERYIRRKKLRKTIINIREGAES